MSGLTRLALNLKVIVFARLGEFSTVTWARFLYSLLFFPLGSEDGSASLSSRGSGTFVHLFPLCLRRVTSLSVFQLAGPGSPPSCSGALWAHFYFSVSSKIAFGFSFSFIPLLKVLFFHCFENVSACFKSLVPYSSWWNSLTLCTDSLVHVALTSVLSVGLVLVVRAMSDPGL